MSRALSFGSGDLNPHWFHKPAFYMYVLFFEYGLYYCVGRILAAWSSVDDFALSFIRNPGSFVLIGRLTTVLFGMASIAGVYRLGERHFGRHVGLVGALLLALSLGHVEVSRTIKADMPTTCFGIWSMVFLLGYVRDPRRWSLVASCVLAGMGAATKYYTVVMLLPVCLAVLLVAGRRGDTGRSASFRGRLISLTIAAVAFVGAYFICAPYNFLDPLGREATFDPVVRTIERGRELLTGETTTRPSDFIVKRANLLEGTLGYGRVLVSHRGLGPVIALMCFAGGLTLVARLNLFRFVFILFPLLFAAGSIVSSPGYAEARHQTPLYPFLAVCGGLFVVSLVRRSGRAGPSVYAALLLAMLYPASFVIADCIVLSRVQTRNAAKQWIEGNIPAGTKLLVDENGPPLMASPSRLDQLLPLAQGADEDGQFTAHYGRLLKYQRRAAEQVEATYDLHEIRVPWWRRTFDRTGLHTLDDTYDRDMGNPLKPVGVHTYDFYVRHQFRYVVTHGDYYNRFFIENATHLTLPAYRRFYNELFERGRLVKQFLPEPVEEHRNPLRVIARWLRHQWSPMDPAPLRGPAVKIFEFVPRRSLAADPDERENLELRNSGREIASLTGSESNRPDHRPDRSCQGLE